MKYKVGTAPNFLSSNCYNLAANCLVLRKSGTECDHVTADTLQLLEMKGSMVKITRSQDLYCIRKLASPNPTAVPEI